MRKEKFKSLILLVLFATSIFLSREFWHRDNVDYNLAKENKEIKLEEDIIRPYKYLINFNSRSHTVVYVDDDLWGYSKSYIARALTNKNSKVSTLETSQYNKLLEQGSLVLNFHKDSNIYILSKFLDIELDSQIWKQVPSINNIYLSLEGEPFIVVESNEVYKKIYNFDYSYDEILERISEIKNSDDYTLYYSIKDSFNVNSNLFIPYNLNRKIPNIYLDNELKIEDLNKVRSFSESFFNKDIDYMREIIEKNGSILHIYNEEVLKYKKSGIIEYFNPVQENISERKLFLSLGTAINFLSEKDLIDENMYLKSIEEIEFKNNLGYRFIFKYYFNDLEVISQEDRDYIEIDVFNNYIQGYKKNIRYGKKIDYVDDEALSLLDLINLNFQVLEEDYLEEDLDDDFLVNNIISDIKDISLYYYEMEDNERNILKPVWGINLGDYIYIFDIYTGDFFDKKIKE